MKVRTLNDSGEIFQEGMHVLRVCVAQNSISGHFQVQLKLHYWLKTLIITTVVGIGQVNTYVSVYKDGETEGRETMHHYFSNHLRKIL